VLFWCADFETVCIWDKSNSNTIMSSLITQPRFSLIPPISLPYGFAFFFSCFFILFRHFPLILLLLLQSFKFIIPTLLNTKQVCTLFIIVRGEFVCVTNLVCGHCSYLLFNVWKDLDCSESWWKPKWPNWDEDVWAKKLFVESQQHLQWKWTCYQYYRD